MTAAAPATKTRWPRQRLVLLLAVLAATAAGVWFAFHSRESPLLTPPEAPATTEPAVQAMVRRARQAVLDSPRSASAWGALAETFLANELDDEGDACAAVAERLDPLDPRWPFFQGGGLLNQGERRQAVVFFRRAAVLDEKRNEGKGTPLLFLAESLLALGELDEAEQALNRAATRQPENARAKFTLGLLAIARGEDETARKHLRSCLNSPHARRKAREQLAPICQRRGEAKEAKRLLDEARQMPPDAKWEDPFVEAYMARSVKKRHLYRVAEQLEAQGRFMDAARTVLPLTESDPRDGLAWLTCGKLLAQAGNGPLAEEALRRALELAPEMVQAQQYLSAHLIEQGERSQRSGRLADSRRQFEEAARLAEQVLAVKPDYGIALLTLGLARRKLGRDEEAVATLRKAVHCNPEYGEIHYRLAEALAATGHAAEARSRYASALRYAPPGATWIKTAREHLNKPVRPKK